MIDINPEAILIAASRRHLLAYSRFTQSDLVVRPFHAVLYEVLDRFAHGKIKKLMITMPPQVGKSEASSRKLPSFIFGLFPDKKIAIGSYSSDIAEGFNRDNQRIIDSPEYRKIFPYTTLNGSNNISASSSYQRNSTVFDIVDHKGWLRVVGINTGLTSKTVDVMIMDDVYKSYEEGNSPIIRDKTWSWYTSVVRPRMHNNSQEIMVFTRWNEDDLIGRISEKETVIDAKTWADIENAPPRAWIKINFPAIQDREPCELDPRQKGEVLWEDMHSLDSILEQKELDPIQFDCLYQGQPESQEGFLYGTKWKTYKSIEDIGISVGKGNYTDTADTGKDDLCSICYDRVKGVDSDGRRCFYLLITDVLLTDKPMEDTTLMLPMMINRNSTRYCNIESNNGGHGFALLIRPRVKNCKVKWFHQSSNKESRILTNCAGVKTHIIMPFDWETRFPDFFERVKHYKRKFEANKHDDVADVLTGIYETEILENRGSRGLKVWN